jgi:peptidoglycan/LPS O-acetylase OafA/YrhL
MQSFCLGIKSVEGALKTDTGAMSQHEADRSANCKEARVIPPSTASVQHLRERIPGLDGIRGVAILMVILFHASVFLDSGTGYERWIMALLKSGWLGVDLFFVLSGFLITRILINSREKPGFFTVFFARRFLRIAPLYFIVLAVVFGVLPRLVSFDSPALSFLKRNQGWFWTYLPNWGFVYHRRAFGNADWLWLDHFWSLAVEEQFYLVWPFVICWSTNKTAARICLVLVAGAFGLRVVLYAAGLSAGALYFPTPCRLDGLSLGALAALVLLEIKNRRDALRKVNRCIAAIVLAFFCLFLYGAGLRFDNRFCLTVGILGFSVLSMCLVLREALRAPDASKSWLECRPLLWLGQYSYGIYVLHHLILPWMLTRFPFSDFEAVSGQTLPGKLAFVLSLLVVSFLLGFISWHCVERWFLSMKRYFSYAPIH